MSTRNGRGLPEERQQSLSIAPNRPPGRPQEKIDPAFVVRAPDSSNRGRWVTVGYAWELRDGGGYSVKLNAIPVGTWDGALVLLPPFAQAEEAKSEEAVTEA